MEVHVPVVVGVAVIPRGVRDAEAGLEGLEVVAIHPAVDVRVAGHRDHHDILVVVAAGPVHVAVEHPGVVVDNARGGHRDRVEARFVKHQARQVPRGDVRLAAVVEVGRRQAGQVHHLAGRVVEEGQVAHVDGRDVVAERDRQRGQLVRGRQSAVALDGDDGRRADVHREALGRNASVPIDHGERHVVDARSPVEMPGRKVEVARLVLVRLQDDRDLDPVAPVDGRVEVVAREVPGLPRADDRLEDVPHLRPVELGLGIDVVNCDGERAADGPAVVVLDGHGNGVAAVVGVLVRPVKSALGLDDRGHARVGRGAVAPVDREGERLAGTGARIGEPCDVRHGQQRALGRGHVFLQAGQHRGGVDDRDDHLRRARIFIGVPDGQVHVVDAVVLGREAEVHPVAAGDGLAVGGGHLPRVRVRAVALAARVREGRRQLDELPLGDGPVVAGIYVLRGDVLHDDGQVLDVLPAVAVPDHQLDLIGVAGGELMADHGALDHRRPVVEVPVEGQVVVAGIVGGRGVVAGLTFLQELIAHHLRDGRSDVLRGDDHRVRPEAAVLVGDGQIDRVGTLVVRNERERAVGPVGDGLPVVGRDLPEEREGPVVAARVVEAGGQVDRIALRDHLVLPGRDVLRADVPDRDGERVGVLVLLGLERVLHGNRDEVHAVVVVRVREQDVPVIVVVRRHVLRAVGPVDRDFPLLKVPARIEHGDGAGEQLALADPRVAAGVDRRRHVADEGVEGVRERPAVPLDVHSQVNVVDPAVARHEAERRLRPAGNALAVVGRDRPRVRARIGREAEHLPARLPGVGGEVQPVVEWRELGGRR